MFKGKLFPVEIFLDKFQKPNTLGCFSAKETGCPSFGKNDEEINF